MDCCPPYLQSFSNVSLTIVPYGAAMKSKYGIAPNINTYFFDNIASEYVISFVPLARILGDTIEVDHGGPSTGYIKIS